MYPFVYEDKANMIGLLGKTVSIMVLVDIVDYVSGKGSGDVDE